MNINNFNIHAFISGDHVNIELKSSSNDSQSENIIEFQGVKYSVLISGLPGESEKAKIVMDALRNTLAQPATKPENLERQFLSHLASKINQPAAAVAQKQFLFLSQGARDNIEAVEKGLLPERIPKGEIVSPATIQDRMRDYKVPSISLAILDQGKIIQAAYGDVATVDGVSLPCTPDVRFQNASVGKPVTAMAILKLVQDKAVDLDEDVNTYLTTWKLQPRENGKVGEKVTLRMLLSHTGGINVSGFDGFEPDSPGTRLSIKDLLEGEQGEPIKIVDEPGSKWQYSGGGYLIVQQLIEDVMNKGKQEHERESFAQIIKRTIFDPLEMNDSSYDLPEGVKFARAHERNGTRLEGDYRTYPQQAAAGFWTTPTDMLKFIQEIHRAFQENQGKILTMESAKEMLRPQEKDVEKGKEENSRSGLGIGVRQEADLTRFTHAGSNAGYKAMMMGFAENGNGAIVMANGENGDWLNHEIIASIANAFDWPTSLKPVPFDIIPLDDAKLKSYQGKYIVEGTQPLEEIRIEFRNGKLYSDNPVIPFPTQLYPVADDKFTIIESGEEYSFLRDAGKITGIKSNLTDQKITRLPQAKL